MKNRKPTQPDLFNFIPSLFEYPVSESSDAALFDPRAAMMEAAAENAANAEAWDGEEEPEAYIELLAQEAELREEIALNARYGFTAPWSGF